ncbi:CDP-archaeol synthase [Nanoarchaeota archaeon]
MEPIIILQVLWLFLPAAIANMSPVFFKKVKFLSYPVDFGLKLRNKPLFGKNKTFRGFFFGTLIAIIIALLQSLFYEQTKVLALIDYSAFNPLLLGFLLGFGALIGDLIESLIKRQFNIPPGHPWFPMDQTDWVFGAIFLLIPFIDISFQIYLIALILFAILHPLANYIGFLLKIKKSKW